MAGRGRGTTSLQSVGVLLGFPALPSALSAVDLAANIPGARPQPARQFSVPLPLFYAASQVYLDSFTLEFSSLQVLWKCLIYSQLGGVPSWLWPGGLNGGHSLMVVGGK